MGFSSKRSGGGGGNFSPAENVAFEVVSYNVKDKYKPSAEDTFNAVLLTEAYGQPVGTELTFRLRKEIERGTTVHSMMYGSTKPRTAPTQVGGQGIAEGSYIDRNTGIVQANWLTVKVREPNSVDQLLVGQYFSVDSERKGNSGYISQPRFMYDVSNATAITQIDKAGLLAVIGAHLAMPSSQLGGEPGFLLRGIDLDNFREDYEPFQATRFTVPRIDEGNGVYRTATPEETVQRFLDSDGAKRFLSALMDPNDPVVNPYIEIIPTARLRTGQDSLPSNNDRGDDSKRFKLQRENSEYFDHYIARAHTHLRWQDPKGEGQDGSFFSTLTLPMQRQAPMYAPAEIPTPGLPPEIADFFAERAAAVGLLIDPPYNRAARPSNDEPSSGPVPR